MPEDPEEALFWVATQLTKSLTEAKMWPIKMQKMKLQKPLRGSSYT